MLGTPELTLKKEKPAGASSRCLRSTALGRAKERKGSKKRRVRTQDMIKCFSFLYSLSLISDFNICCFPSLGARSVITDIRLHSQIRQQGTTALRLLVLLSVDVSLL